MLTSLLCYGPILFVTVGPIEEMPKTTCFVYLVFTVLNFFFNVLHFSRQFYDMANGWVT